MDRGRCAVDHLDRCRIFASVSPSREPASVTASDASLDAAQMVTLAIGCSSALAGGIGFDSDGAGQQGTMFFFMML
ncbi:hypothetical protein [Pseudoduganella umbonata]|uniref:Uncharacterized protein n=1 Tax=Pseudoduganella umbonata TaxID=864828 RepID=A0A4P8HMA3_9BURK|nr:hypothetical protein [Pseudoduganella umbonata]MBB3222651.1 hypothetical protein [Pseudoduganella umbonata]QCP10843.1 hypothetical protein FCL38_10680 [Pseudoduganella umbonata]